MSQLTTSYVFSILVLCYLDHLHDKGENTENYLDDGQH